MSVRIFAPAKINLDLRIIGRRDDGYHELQSLIAFADIGDEIEITPHPEYCLEISGPFAEHFTPGEKGDVNLATLAAHRLAAATERAPGIHIQLIKNLPLASGLGGGSADAAAVIRGLMRLWNISADAAFMPALLQELGADVPACFEARAARIMGKGEIFQPVNLPAGMPVLLVNPGAACPTRPVFENFKNDFSEPLDLPPQLEDFQTLVQYLHNSENDLTSSAAETIPDIVSVLRLLAIQPGCRLVRMSGSGATCFALFETVENARRAALAINALHPDWWIKSGLLNSQ